MPANPVPTTMTEYFRLFAGLTSFKSNLCRVHFSSMGPGGILASSVKRNFPSLSHPHQTGGVRMTITKSGMLLNPAATTTPNATLAR